MRRVLGSVRRRDFLRFVSVAAATPLLARCSPASQVRPGGAVTFEPPQRLATEVTRLADGTYVRSFAGVAAPQNLEYRSADGARHRVFDMFPNDHCPFGIDTRRELGPGGYDLQVLDRTLGGIVPTPTDALWALNMIPFGVAIDGALLDPSGPWFDGGPADPQNPFDRACSGWEYDPIFDTVATLVGVPAELRGHCQPGPGNRMGSPGQFHYHGTPSVMLANLRAARRDEELERPLVVGYAADGFWVIDAVIPAESTRDAARLHLFSGYVLREGTRAPVPHTNPQLVPSGTHDGTFTQDWAFDPIRKRALIEAALSRDGHYLGLTADDRTAGLASYALLDERNGLVTDAFTLPDAPARTYVYVLTPDFPEVPRWLAFEPSASFRAVIPFEAPSGAMGPPGRRQLYAACSTDLVDVHQWSGRPPY